MSRSYDNEKKPSQSTFSFKPTASFLQTRPFAPIQADLDEDVEFRPSGYTENFLEKIINQRSTESSDTPVQTKTMNRLRRPLQDKRVSMIQAKLSIGEPNDKYEQEADATASKVVQQINSPMQDQSVQKQESMEEEEELQMKPISSIQREAAIGEEEELQMKSLVQRRENHGGGEASTDLESSIQSARSSGQSLDPNLQEKMGQAMGADFSSVKVHTDSQSDQLNKSIQAKAFTTGQDIFFRQGEYNPSSTGGQELLAHELTHVVQQNGSTIQRRKKVQMKPDLQLHQEEDEVQMKPDLQLHQEEDEVQMKPDLQLHQEEDEVQMKPKLQRHQEEDEVQMKPKLQRHQEEDEVQMKPKLQRHQEEDEVQMKPKLQRHQEEDEVQMKPDLQMRETSNGCTSGCQCSSCSPSGITVQRKINTSQTNSSKNLLNRKLIDMVQQDSTQIRRFSDSAAHSTGCPCSDCGATQTQIQRKTETDHGSGCSCPTCSGSSGEIQTKSILQRHLDRNGSQISPVRSSISSIQRREDEMVQTKPISTQSSSTIQQTANPNIIQRHASWEHKMLGDVSPDALEVMGAGRNQFNDLGNAVDEEGNAILINEGIHQGKYITKKMVLHTIEQEIRRLEYFRDQPPKDASKKSAQKLTQSDMNDRYKQTHKEEGSVAASQEFDEDKKWQVRLVKVPLQNGRSEVVTYGEMNTLADFYGSLNEMKRTDPDNFHKIVQGIRQESLFKFMRLYEEISQTRKYQEKAELARAEKSKLGTGQKVALALLPPALIGYGVYKGGKAIKDKAKNKILDNEFEGLGFEGAIGNVGTGDLYGELSLMGNVPGQEGKKALKGDKTSEYTAGLARNACHFAPESWHSWAKYHNQALDSAKKAFDEQEVATKNREEAKEKAKKSDPSADGNMGIAHQAELKASELANEAYLNNGFGDHYLQDSYAAGHLINKTQIMQWYVQWIDKNDEWDYHKDKNWRKAQNMAYNQPGLASPDQYNKDEVGTTGKAKNPQLVEDMEGGWEEKHDALGLEMPSSLARGTDSYKLIAWWQTETLKRFRVRPRAQTIKTLLKESPVKNFKLLETALSNLFYQGVIRLDKYETSQIGQKSITVPMDATVVLRDAYVPKDKARFKEALKDPQKYETMVKAVNFKEYESFMKSSFIQKSTNALHDHFCAEGLDVYSGDSEKVFKIYGDNAMLKAQSSVGVKHSSETSRKSVQSIDDVIATGKTTKTTDSIVNRFPEGVDWKGTKMSLSDWHNKGALQNFCDTRIFPDMSWQAKQKLVGIVPGKEIGSLGEIHKDHPHAGEEF